MHHPGAGLDGDLGQVGICLGGENPEGLDCWSTVAKRSRTPSFHVRLHCPHDSPECKAQPPACGGDGCGKDLSYWFTDAVLHRKPSPGRKLLKPGKPLSEPAPGLPCSADSCGGFCI